MNKIQNYKSIGVRFTPEEYDFISERAKANNRSMGKEIIHVIKEAKK